MSRTKNGCTRCDSCGKLSNNHLGEYTKPDGMSAGYIHSPEHERNEDGSYKPDCGTLDICEECADDLCPECGSDCIVKITPATPGPDGWGGRCKQCDHQWFFTDRSEP